MAKLKNRKYNIVDIERIVAKIADITLAELYTSRSRRVSQLRQIVWFIAKEMGYTYQAIADHYGRSLSTIYFGVNYAKKEHREIIKIICKELRIRCNYGRSTGQVQQSYFRRRGGA